MYLRNHNRHIMKNPIGKIKREKLDKIENDVESFKEKFNFVEESIGRLGFIGEKLNTFVGEMKPIIELFQQPEEEPTEEEMKKAQEEQMSQLKEVVKSALVDLWNDEQNQAAIAQFVQGMRGGEQGLADMGLDLNMLRDKDGYIDPLAAGIMWFMNRDKSGLGKGPSKARTPLSPDGKAGAY